MQQNNNNAHKQDAFPPANTGNASNPSADDQTGAPSDNQLLDEKAEKYLREAAPIEDYPDDEDWQEAEKTIEEEKGKGPAINPS